MFLFMFYFQIFRSLSRTRSEADKQSGLEPVSEGVDPGCNRIRKEKGDQTKNNGKTKSGKIMLLQHKYTTIYEDSVCLILS
jgi:hypothetical protein